MHYSPGPPRDEHVVEKPNVSLRGLLVLDHAQLTLADEHTVGLHQGVRGHEHVLLMLVL